MTKIIIVGGGIVARCCARALVARGCSVTLVAEPDPDPPSWGNAGHIATEQISPLAQWATLRRLGTDLFPRGPVAIDWQRPRAWLPWSALFLLACLPAQNRTGRAALRQMMAGAMPAWERLVQHLGEPDLLDRHGIVKLIESPDAAAQTRRATDEDWGTAQAVRLDAAELDAINALLRAPMRAAVRFAGTAHVTDPRRVLDALLAAFLGRGGIHETAHVSAIRPGTGGIVVETSQTTYHADQVVIAGGVRSGALLPGIVLPMIAERGYHLQWDHGGAWSGPNVVFEERALVVTRFGKRLRATSFVEFTDHAAPPDPRKWDHIERHVRELGLPVRGEFARWHGSRPTLPDYLPAIGSLAAAGLPGVYAACGHNHLGLTLGPVTAELLTAHMLDGAPLPAAMRPDRFSKSPFRSIQFRRQT